MEIISIRAEKLFAGPGMDAHEGEIKTWDETTRNYLYIHCTFFDGAYFTVARESMMDYLLNGDATTPFEIEFIEEYENLCDAMNSKYIDGFILLNNLLNEMIDFTYGHRESVYNYIVSPIEFEDVEGDALEQTLAATFQYQTKSMKNSVQRKAVVRVTDGIVTLCSMYDEAGNAIESFENVESAERSKWMLLYQKMVEKISDQ